MASCHGIPFNANTTKKRMRPVTLPIGTSDGLRMDPKQVRALGSLLAEDCCRADPLPHVAWTASCPSH